MIRLSLLILALAARLPAAEEILSFDSTIKIEADGTLDVHELIRVRAEGQAIKRGIYRDLPTTYGPSRHIPHVVPVKAMGVLRNGQAEAWRTVSVQNGLRIYAGHPEHFIDKGEHSYQFHYRTSRQLKFLQGHDELYWNATGNGWNFRILQASCEVELPGPPAGPWQSKGFTGFQGSKQEAYRFKALGPSKVRFESTRALGPKEGLTIVLGWPKGVLAPPSARQEAWWKFTDARELWLMLASLPLVLLLFYSAWRRHGVDPRQKPIVPQFYPPEGMPPAALAYLDHEGSGTALSATLLHLAVRGFLKITKNKWSGYALEKMKGEGKLDGLDKAALDLFGASGSRNSAEADDARHFLAASQGVQAQLKSRYRPDEPLNLSHLLPGMALLGCSLLAMGVWGQGERTGAFMLALLLLLACWGSAWNSMVLLERAKPGREASKARSLASVLLLAAGLALGWVLISRFPRLWLALEAGAGGLMLGVFFHLMKRPGEGLQRQREAIQGFRMYLGAAEKDRLEKMHPPEETPALFEKYLPYAFALGVGSQWGRRFEDALAGMSRKEREAYIPLWYSGQDFSPGHFSAFSKSFDSDFSSSMATASIPPSSSGDSGFSGGGSSGGGGGGGGGGGW